MQKKWAKETKLMKNGETLMTAGAQAVDHDESAARLCNLPPAPLLTFSHTSPHSPVPPGIFQWLERKFGRVLCVKKRVSEKVEQYLI